MKRNTIFISIISISFCIATVYYFNINTQQSTNNTKINEPVREITTELILDQTVDVSNNTNIKSNKIKYSKVVLPKELQDIHNTYVDIQNGAEEDLASIEDKYSENKDDFEDFENQINKMEQMISEFNEELGLTQEEIAVIENSYDEMMAQSLPTEESQQLAKAMENLDNEFLQTKSDLEKLLGELE